MAVVYSKVLLFDPPLIYTAPDTCVFGAVHNLDNFVNITGLMLLDITFKSYPLSCLNDVVSK